MQADVAGKFSRSSLTEAELKIPKLFNLQYRTLDIGQGGVFGEMEFNMKECLCLLLTI